ncbi:prepilin peptidase [Escherichia coli]|uniref:prepilin peptidase n=1 Tax=Escherichia coli TaxID=562 RepID=UPI0038B2C356
MIIEIGIFLFYFVTGLCVGSFLNVVIYRVPLALTRCNDKIFNVAWPPSHCFSCKRNILKRDNIPVFSWIILKGRCRFCGADISPRYPFIELVTGIGYAMIGTLLTVQNHGQNWLFMLPVLFLFSVLLCLITIDIDHLLLPDNIVFMLLWAGLLCSVLDISSVSLRDAVLGVIITWLCLSGVLNIFNFVRKQQGMGAGDVKLYSALGAWLGWYQMPALLILSSFVGIIMFLTFRKRPVSDISQDGKALLVIPYGPAIALSGFILYILSLSQYITG